MKSILLVITGILCFTLCQGQSHTVSNNNELIEALKKVRPGDTVYLKNGVWKDVRFSIVAYGAKGKPVVISAETPGKVFVEGKSNLQLGGNYVEVRGLYFRNGYTPSDAVISFRSGKTFANNCRITACVIEDYNPGDRFYDDNWVALYGKHNRFDHNHLSGKLSSGVTLAVMLEDTAHQKNYHRIDHNFFGERPRLGSNGGETMRVGNSQYSLTSSYTQIEDNYFYKCNGEVEIISLKSCNNVVRRNTFFESEGSVVLRHGNNNIVEGNLFQGNGKPFTGGVRVINAGHKIFNNYFDGLRGSRFQSALAIMNGVPNSLINRYHQVKDTEVAFNTFVNCDHISLGVGSDHERTAVPVRTSIINNVFYYDKPQTFLEVLADMRGVSFGNNVSNIAVHDTIKGFEKVQIEKIKVTGDYSVIQGVQKKVAKPAYLQSDLFGKKRSKQTTVGAYELKDIKSARVGVSIETTGAPWFKNRQWQSDGLAEKRIVRSDRGNWIHNIENAKDGDIIELSDAGTYVTEVPVMLSSNITIKGKDDSRVKVQYKGEADITALMVINEGIAVNVANIEFDGAGLSEGRPRAGIATRTSSMPQHYSLRVANCDFHSFHESGYAAIKAYKNTFGDTIKVENTTFSDMSGDAISLSSEKDDKGRYNAEVVIISNCLFYDVMGAAADVYRGGNDESTVGPTLRIAQCTFHNVNNKENGDVLRLIGVQDVNVVSSLFSASGKGGRIIRLDEARWHACNIADIGIYNSGRIQSNYNKIGNVITGNPMFGEDNSFTFGSNSPFFNKSIGFRR